MLSVTSPLSVLLRLRAGLVVTVVLGALLSLTVCTPARADEALLYEPFSRDADPGQVATVYRDSLWMIDAAGSAGTYKESNVSAHDGYLDFTLSDKKTGGYVAMGPDLKGYLPGTRFRFSVKVKGNGEGWGMAHLLWPVSDKGAEGELDFPEGQLSSRMKLYHHTMTCRRTDGYCGNEVSVFTKTRFNDGDWHQVDIRWTKTYVKYVLDGKTVAKVKTSVPTTAHRPVIQIALDGGRPPHGTTHVEIGKYRIEKMTD